MSKKIFPRQINNLFKLAKVNQALDKLHKRRFMDKLMDHAFNKYIKELLINLISKYDDNAKKELLRNKFEHWRKQVNRLKDYEDSMAQRIRLTWKTF
jgi:Mg/Co/Ni transporter MgtE